MATTLTTKPATPADKQLILSRAKSLAQAIGSERVSVPEKIRAIHEMIDLYEPELVRSLPAGVSGKQLVALAKQHLREKPELLECTPDSLMSSLSRGMLGGFEFGGPRADAYIVPFNTKLRLPNGKEVWRKLATCIESWRGLVRLVRNTGQMVREPRVHAVYEGEQFDVRTVDYQTVIEHQPDPRNAARVADDDAKIVAFYAAFFLKSGTVAHWMPRSEVDAIRDNHSKGHGQAKKNKHESIWDKHYKEMGFKSVERQMIARGMLPVSHDQLRASERFERIEQASESDQAIDAVSWSVLSDDLPGIECDPGTVTAQATTSKAAEQSDGTTDAAATEKPSAATTAQDPAPGSIAEFLDRLAKTETVKAAGEIRDQYGFDGPLADRANEAFSRRKAELRHQADTGT